ncbi:AraC family transcriptional regulator [Actinokineospora soli]|uniref:AraC family transcriptional regulator n=1 Tax=Actinokineospora soli TaxID=1048753 RepID=A0ABW2TGQ1_9PSEU
MSLMRVRTQSHDRAPAVPDRNAGPADALAGLRLRGAIFLRGEYTEGWSYESLPAEDAAALLHPGSRRVVLFHVVARGRCWIEAGEDRHWADAGDVIVLPYGDAHRMGGATEAEPVSVLTLIDPPPWSSMPVIRHGRGGDRTDVVCGYLACDDPLFDPRLRAFPPVFVVRPPQGRARDWVRASIEYAADQTSPVSAHRIAGPSELPELLLREVLKLHLASAPAAPTGWMAALRDPVLAPALAAVHAAPGAKWTVAELARVARVSATVLDERFRDVVGVAPIRYLTGWRMHVAEDLLAGSDLGIGAIAHRVGYESEEAFSRAFKRRHGQAPSVWRG